MQRLILTLLTTGLLFAAPVVGQNQHSEFIISTDSGSFFGLPKYIRVYHDQAEEATIAEVANPSFDSNFTPLAGYGEFEMNKTYWGKFQIRSALDYDQDLLLYSGGGDHFELYYGDGKGDLVKGVAGFLTPLSQRTDPEGHSQILPIRLRSGESITGFVKLRSENFAGPRFQMELFTPQGLKKVYNPAKRNLFQGIFQGVLWIMIIYNLFFFFMNRDKTFVFYAAYMLTISLFFANMFGYMRNYVFPELPVLYIYVWLVAQTSAIFYIQFVRHFLNLKELLPKWDRVSQFLIKGMIAFVVFKAAYYLTVHEYGILGELSQILIFAKLIGNCLVFCKIFWSLVCFNIYKILFES